MNQDQKRALARCSMIVDLQEPACILGYYTLSAHSIRLHHLPENIQKGVPYSEVPAALIGRFAISIQQQGKGLGGRLLAQAVEQCLSLEQQLGLRLVVVDDLSDRAALFYERYGFSRFSGDPLRLFLVLKHVRM